MLNNNSEYGFTHNQIEYICPACTTLSKLSLRVLAHNMRDQDHLSFTQENFITYLEGWIETFEEIHRCDLNDSHAYNFSDLAEFMCSNILNSVEYCFIEYNRVSVRQISVNKRKDLYRIMFNYILYFSNDFFKQAANA